MKKGIALLLSAFILFSLVGCSSGGEKKSDPDPSEETVGFDGKEFILWQDVDDLSLGNFTPFFYTAQTTLDDLYQARLKEIEQEQNCVLTFEFFDDSVGDKLTAAVGTMSQVVDVLLTASEGVVYPAAAAGHLTPLTDFSDIIDLSNSAKYGSLGELEATTVNSVPYGVCPVGLPGLQNFGLVAVGVFLNDVITEYNLTSPREYVEQGVWNWDTFKTCLTDYTVNEGERTVKAFNLVNYIFTECALLNNGVKYVEKTETGYGSALNSPQTVEALEFHQSVIRDYADCILDNQYNWCDELTPLAAGESVMAICGSWMVTTSVAKEIDNFGLFPFPTGPSGEAGSWKTAIDVTQALTIPVLTDDGEATATLISLMLDPLEGYETQDALADYYNNVFFDERDSDLFFSLGQNSSFSYWNVGGYDFVSYVSGDIRKKSPTELIEKYSSRIEDTINNYMVPNYEFLNGQN